MNKALYALISLLAFTSCLNNYNVQGTSNLSSLDGHMLYLKVMKNNRFKNVDSCEVVHGQFHFSGNADSVRMANIFMDDESVMPLVLERGDITVRNQYNQLKGRQSELVHRHDQAIMDGKDMVAVTSELNAEAMKISQEEDSLVTSFVTENFDNVLGPGVFFMVTNTTMYPQLIPWIEDIMSKATDHFKNDPYVKDYYEKAQENQAIMNGMKEMPKQ